VLRPGGELRFFEHVRSASPLAGAFQDLITPLWARAGGGCHLNRDTTAEIRAAGFEVDAGEPGVLESGQITHGPHLYRAGGAGGTHGQGGIRAARSARVPGIQAAMWPINWSMNVTARTWLVVPARAARLRRCGLAGSRAALVSRWAAGAPPMMLR
jgi:hypothetical protein